MPKKLTRPHFHAIKRELATGTSKLSTATKYNVSYETVRKISHASTWSKYGQNNASKAANSKLSQRTTAAVATGQSFVTRSEFILIQREIGFVRRRVEMLEAAHSGRRNRWFGRHL